MPQTLHANLFVRIRTVLFEIANQNSFRSSRVNCWGPFSTTTLTTALPTSPTTTTTPPTTTSPAGLEAVTVKGWNDMLENVLGPPHEKDETLKPEVEGLKHINN